MKRELINELFEKFENARYIYEGVECWSAREMQVILGYSKWDNFINVIDKAKISCKKSGYELNDHFADIGKMVDIGRYRDNMNKYLKEHILTEGIYV